MSADQNPRRSESADTPRLARLRAYADRKGFDLVTTPATAFDRQNSVALRRDATSEWLIERKSGDSIDTAAFYLLNALELLGVAPDPNVVASVCAVVERDSQYLMLQRGATGLGFVSDGHGQWAHPGGWIEHGETAQDAAVRECEEETGVVVRPVGDDGFTVTRSPSGFTIVTLFVVCRYVGGVAVNREPDKALAVDWVHREMLVELDLFGATDAWWRRPR